MATAPETSPRLCARILDGVRRTLADALPRPGRGLLVGFSGGVDSTALLHLLVELRPEGLLVAAHLDHRLRPDSGEQARFAAGVARSLGLDYTVARAEVAGRARREGRSLEEAGRLARRRFFREVARRRGLDAVLLGHTATDQAETVLFRLARGAGALGLGAMAPVREDEPGLRLVRPLLGVSRAELVRLADAAGWPRYEDPSNRDPRFVRNRIRHEVLPLLREAVNPRVEAALGRAAEVAREDENWLGAETRRRFREAAEVERDGDRVLVRMRAAELRAAPPALARRLLREGFRAARGDLLRLELVHLDAALRVLRSGRGTAALDLPGARLELGGGAVTISARRNRGHAGAFPSPADPDSPDL